VATNTHPPHTRLPNHLCSTFLNRLSKNLLDYHSSSTLFFLPGRTKLHHHIDSHRPCHQYHLQHTVPCHRPSCTPPLHNHRSVQPSKSYIPNINIRHISSFSRLQRSKIHIQQPRYSSIQLSPVQHTRTISKHHRHSRPTLQVKSHPGTPAKHATSLSAGSSRQLSISPPLYLSPFI
jgi:hypothetical protein